MANLPQAANTEGNNEKMGFKPMPEGQYVMMIVDSFWKKTKDKKGKYIQLDMVVTQGEFAERKFVERLNLVNANKTAVQIANGTLNSLCEACGLSGVEDTEELHNIEFLAELGVEPGVGKYGPKNVARDYLPMEDHPDDALYDGGEGFQDEE